MKINSLYISAFGGIKDLKLDFNDGFNIIYGENENGKSTVMAFIKMMFYGSERGSSRLSKSIRKKYTPWDGGAMAGSIDFEHSGKAYRIEREFRLSNSTDKVTLYDLNLGERLTAPPDIGTKFLGLSLSAFERSVFIGQFGYPESDPAAEGEINSRLSNLALTGDESISFDTVSARLEKAKTALMSKSGKAGEYDKNLKLCTQLKERIDKAYEKISEFDLKRSEIARLKEESLKIAEAAERLKTKIDSERDISNREILREYLRLKKSLDGLNSELMLNDGTLADEMFLRKLRFCLSKTEAAAAKLLDKQSQTDKLKADIAIESNPPENTSPEFADRLKKDIALSEKKREEENASELILKMKLSELKEPSVSGLRTVTTVLSVFGALLLVSAIISKILNFTLPFVPTAALGILLVSVFPVFVSVSRNNAKRISSERRQINEQLKAVGESIAVLTREIADKRKKLEAVNTALNSNAAVVESKRKMLAEAENELQELKALEAKEKSTLLELAEKYTDLKEKTDINTVIEEIAEKAAKQREIKQQLNYIASQLNNISYDEAREKLSEVESNTLCEVSDFAALKEEYRKLTEKLNENSSKTAALAAELKIATAGTENPEELKKELKALLARTAEQKEFCDASDIAREVLLESFTEIRKSYGSVLEKTAGEFFSELTQSKYDGMTVSKAFEINVTEADAFGSRELAYLSSGTEDQAYLSLRLAISRLICGDGETLPVFLDDSLAQYDDVRMKNAVGCLKKISDKMQIIMFTCHNAVKLAGEETDAFITAL